MKFTKSALQTFLAAAVATSTTMTSITSTTTVQAMPASPQPFHEIQPDGRFITLQLQGDPLDAWLADQDGYTVLRDETTGEYRYAQDDGHGGLECSEMSVGLVDDENDNVDSPDNDASKGSSGPAKQTKLLKQRKNHMKKGLRPSKIDCEGKWCDDFLKGDDDEVDAHQGGGDRRSLRGFVVDDFDHFNATRSLQQNPNTGILRNLVIPMKWSDHQDRILPSQEQLDTLMNNDGPHPLCPTGSLRDVFLENSYGSLTLNSVVLDWIPMDNTEVHYSNGDRGLTTRFWDAIEYALNYIEENELVDFAEFDQNPKDGRIDAITFLHSGYAAEFGRTDAYGTTFTNRIWSHKWSLNRRQFTSPRSGVRVRDYHVASAVWGTSGVEIGRIGVIAHETGHFLGLPDLYDVNGGGNGIGSYGMMGNSWGFDGSQYYPPHLSAWSKLRLGWVEAVRPTQGTNLVEASEILDPTHPQLYIIDEGFPSGEYLLVENRQRIGFDRRMPQGGLVIYHIDEQAGLHQEGFPGQVGWPENGNHYRVAVLAADGLYQLESNQFNRGDGGDVYQALGPSNWLAPCMTEGACQHPNTDSYQGGVIVPSNVYITGISNSASVMSFQFSILSGETSEPTGSPTTSPTWEPTNFPTTSPSSSPSSSPSASPTVMPTLVPTTQAPTVAPSPLPSTLAPTPRPTVVPLSVNVAVEAGQGEMTYNIAVSVNGGTAPFQFAWSFGDGKLGFSREPVRSHTYPAIGNYAIRVIAIDAKGNSQESRYTLRVTAAPTPAPTTTTPTTEPTVAPTTVAPTTAPLTPPPSTLPPTFAPTPSPTSAPQPTCGNPWQWCFTNAQCCSGRCSRRRFYRCE